MSHNILNHTENGLVVFCGAGVSMVSPTCLPSWWEMNEQVVNALSRQIASFCTEEEAADLALQINNRRNKGHFPPEFQAEIISEHYGSSYFKVLECLDGDEANAVHLGIAALAKSGHVRAVVTSNFDRLLEVAFRKLKVPFDLHFQEEHFENLAKNLNQSSPKPSRCQLLKLHGSVDDHLTLVDTLAQRMQGFSPSINSCLQHLLCNYYWLFMGYSGGDLEGNRQYLCLQSESSRAVGFSWLVQESSRKEPAKAVTETWGLYGDRADSSHGELPAWFFKQFKSLLPDDLPVPTKLSKKEQAHRKKFATQDIIDHTKEWSEEMGGVRAALVLSQMLNQSVGNPQAARDLLTRVLDTLGDDDVANVAVANSLANLLIKEGNLKGAMDLLTNAMSKIDSNYDRDDDRERARIGILSTMGLIENEKGEYQKALDLFKQVYDTSVRLMDENTLSIALHNQAMALSSLGRFEDALSYYDKEFEIVKKLGDTIAQAQVLNNKGDLLRQLDKYSEAINVFKEGIDLRERLGDDRGVANGMGNIAAVYQSMGNLPAAKSIYEKVLAIFQRIKDKASEITTINNLGIIAQELGDLQKAEQNYQQGLKIAKEGCLEPAKAIGLWKLASIFRESDREVEAEGLYMEALEIYKRNGNPSGEADVLNEIGILFWQTGQLDKAETNFRLAIDIRLRLNQISNRCTAMGNLALVLKDKGELGQALALLKEKLHIAQKLQNKSLIANAYYNIGTVQLLQKGIDEALESFNTARLLFQEMGSTHREMDILAIMGEICGCEGKIGLSLQWFDEAIPLASSVKQRTIISRRLTSVLNLLLENGYHEFAEHYIRRLRSVGAQVGSNES